MLPTLIGAVAKAVDIPHIARTMIENYFPNDSEERKAERIAELEIVLAQIRVNEESAKHPSLFVAGARPFSIWCSNVIIAVYAIAILVSWFAFPDISIPDQADTIFLGVVGAWCGLHGIRSFDKLKGTARSSL